MKRPRVYKRYSPGFTAIHYKGKMVKAETEYRLESVLVARNKLQAAWWRLRYRKLGLRVVVERWAKASKVAKEIPDA